MSDDWDTVTKIGSKTRTGGGAGPRQTVVKGKSALNAAARQGNIIGTEKKYASANSVSNIPAHRPQCKRPQLIDMLNAQKNAVEGQHLTKVDRSDDIVKPKTIGQELGKRIGEIRHSQGLSQKDLAEKCHIPLKDFKEIEAGRASRDQNVMNMLENKLNVRLQGSGFGEPKFKKKEGK